MVEQQQRGPQLQESKLVCLILSKALVLTSPNLPFLSFFLQIHTEGFTVFRLSWTVGYWVNETDAAPP